MRTSLTIGALCLGATLLAGCVQQQGSLDAAAASPAGQLFCALQTAGGGDAIVKVIDAEATAKLPSGAAPVAVLAAGATKAYVDGACQKAAANTGSVSGIPVSPPTAGAAVASVAVTPPAPAVDPPTQK